MSKRGWAAERIEEATLLTLDLRGSATEPWASLRMLLEAQGFDPSVSAIGQSFPEDTGQFCTLADRSGRGVNLEYTDSGDRGGAVRLNFIEELNGSELFPWYAPAVWAALKVLDAESPLTFDPTDVLVSYVGALTADVMSAEDEFRPLRRAAALEWPHAGSIACLEAEERNDAVGGLAQLGLFCDVDGRAWELRVDPWWLGTGERPSPARELDTEEAEVRLGPLVEAARRFLN